MRRLAGAVEVPTKRGGNLRELRQAVSSIAGSRGSSLSCRVSLVCFDRDLQSRRPNKEIRRGPESCDCGGAKSDIAGCKWRLGRESPKTALHGATRNSDVWERGVNVHGKPKQSARDQSGHEEMVRRV